LFRPVTIETVRSRFAGEATTGSIRGCTASQNRAVCSSSRYRLDTNAFECATSDVRSAERIYAKLEPHAGRNLCGSHDYSYLGSVAYFI
jgi:hypothetical protein